ncbi:MAG: 30S ribosomal protein S7 [Chloroflexota bacterium]|nr:30S ribosomal protein S7 [Chloroflexota bacterium]
MPRRASRVVVRERPPDARYNSVTVTKFINKIMSRGQKATAQRIVYDALEEANQRLGKDDPAGVLQQAIANATPLVMVKSRRVGGATYQVPKEVKAERGSSLAVRWIIAAARARKGRSMAERLAAELVEAAQGQGVAAKKRSDVHRMAEANKAFAHYRW